MPRYSVTYACVTPMPMFADLMIEADNQDDADAKAEAHRESITGWYPDPDAEYVIEVRSVIEYED